MATEPFKFHKYVSCFAPVSDQTCRFNS